MASTYALPVDSHTHSHGRLHSQSHYFTAPSPNRKALSPVDEGNKPTSGHQHRRSDMSGQLYGAVRSPYVEYNSNAPSHSHGHSHSHSHAHTNSNGSTHSLTSFTNSRPNGRLGLESPQTPRKNAAAAKYGMFSPVQESAPVPPSSSLLDLPEALTALLIPLPFLLASIAYPSAARKLPATLSEALVENEPAVAAETAANEAYLLNALFLTSATLLVVGLIGRVRSSLDQPLDRRKADSSRSVAAALSDVSTLKQITGNIAGVLLPFFATMQIGGAKTALVLLTAIAAGLGATDHKPGKHTHWDDMKRTLRTRRTTFAVLLIGTIVDVFAWGHPACALLGYGALFTSIFAAPLPLPTAGWSLITGNQTQDSYMGKGSARASLPKPSSPLISTSETTLLTCSIIHSVMIERDSRRIAYFGVLNLSFMIVQFFYGFVSGSLGLLTDSIHMLFDCAGLAVGLAAAVMSKWRPNARFPYGYGKIDTLSGFANGVFLLLVSVEIIFDAFERLWEGHELQRLNELLINMQGIFLHILADALGSVAVIISTLLTKYYGWSGWDPIASCIIAILIFLSAIPLVKSSGMRLMLSLPTDAEYGVRNTLQELSSLRGVVGYTVPKFWLEDEGAAHADTVRSQATPRPAMSVIYKRSERERDWETQSQGGARSYTTVRRYKVPDHSLEEDTYEQERMLVHRPREDYEERREVRKEYIVERNDPPPARSHVSEYRYVDRSPSPPRREVREYRIEREVDRSPSPARSNAREIRISREYERDALEQQRDYQPYELERYSRDVEFFRPEPTPAPQPQPIIIRNEAQPAQQPIIIREEVPQPIIIRERIQEPAYELVERSEVYEDRQVARPRPRLDEDYYYERRVKEVDRGGRRDERWFDEREYRDRHGDREYYSDDDAVYVHKEKDVWERDGSPNGKRSAAAGALAGVAAGQIIRHHRKRKGEEAGGNIGNALGYGALGAASAVALDRYNNRDRSRSLSSDRGRRRRHRSKSRNRSKSRVREVGTLAALAGVGLAAYAVGKRNKEKNAPVTTVVEEHRKVGLASAAVAGLVERNRSKSRKRKGKRSPSRIRQGVPIAAAGVAGAALTGLYENRKAKKEASRARSVAETAAVAGVAGLAAHEAAKRRDRKKAEKERDRRHEDESAYSEGSYSRRGSHEHYSPGGYSPGESTARPNNDSQYFPSTNYFPPPPTAPVDGNLPNAPYPPYNPADYPPHNNYGPPPPSGGYVHDDMNPGNPYARQDQNHYYQARRGDENVSAPVPVNSGAEHVTPISTRGLNKARDESPALAPSPVSTREKGVKFDLNPQEQEISPNPSPERHDDRDHRERRDDSDSGDERHGSDRDRDRRRRHADERSNGSQGSGRDRKRHRRAESPGSDTDSTIELPPRFDKEGRRRDDDPAAERLEKVLQSLFR
ncbi:hypothetical protein E8E11_002658 [Didymella keratinophila]|nr:hypothetical protein E8E11_002658 [Didymella keratinophila]